MKVGDLIKIVYKHGSVHSSIGVYLGEIKVNHTIWVNFLNEDGEKQSLYKFDYIFEVINELDS